MIIYTHVTLVIIVISTCFLGDYIYTRYLGNYLYLHVTLVIIVTSTRYLKGFVKLKKIQKSEKNSEVGGWVKPQFEFVFFLEILCFSVLFFAVHVSKKKNRMGGGWV